MFWNINRSQKVYKGKNRGSYHKKAECCFAVKEKRFTTKCKIMELALQNRLNYRGKSGIV